MQDSADGEPLLRPEEHHLGLQVGPVAGLERATWKGSGTLSAAVAAFVVPDEVPGHYRRGRGRDLDLVLRLDEGRLQASPAAARAGLQGPLKRPVGDERRPGDALVAGLPARLPALFGFLQRGE